MVTPTIPVAATIAAMSAWFELPLTRPPPWMKT
jgi:hypothetical protein